MRQLKDRVDIVSVSGGKDSTATLLLAKERPPENMVAVFCDTGHEHKITYEYIEYLSKTVFPIRTIKVDLSKALKTRVENLGEGGSTRKQWEENGVSGESVERVYEFLKNYKLSDNAFLDLAVIKGRFPSKMAKFCTEALKIKAFQNQIVIPSLEGYDMVVSWVGERAEESKTRAMKSELEEVEDKNLYGSYIYRPILKWTWREVFDMHSKHNVKPNPLYKMGMKRVGCMPCIFASKQELSEIFKRFPEVVENIKMMEKEVNKAQRGRTVRFFSDDKTPGGLSTVDTVKEWSKTSRGGVQKTLKSTRPAKPCESMYGLCE